MASGFRAYSLVKEEERDSRASYTKLHLLQGLQVLLRYGTACLL